MSQYPKIELHVHLEGTVRAATLLEIAKRNDYALPADTVEGLAELYTASRTSGTSSRCGSSRRTHCERKRTTARWSSTTRRKRRPHGAVYLEGIFSPAERVRHGCTWEDVFEGVCNGAQEARELHGVEIRLTPDIPRGFTQEEARATVDWCARYMDRGVVAVGLGGLEAEYPPEPYESVFKHAKTLGLGSVPHAGEVAGAPSVRGAIDSLEADRLRHGIRAEEDPPASSGRSPLAGSSSTSAPSRTSARARWPTLHDHRCRASLPQGVLCSISTDDPAMFDTDLSRDYEAATSFGLDPRSFYDAGLAGALCDAGTKERLRQIGDSFDWPEYPSG